MRSYFSVLCLVLGVVLEDVFTNELPLEYPAVNTVSGMVIGSVAKYGDYYEYLGIPYADSTSGNHRFKAPSPPPHFTEPFIASRRDIKCVHAAGFGYEGTEDCLVANVYTPTLDNTKELPVMVWVNGREFNHVHDQELSFKQFVEKDVIVVSLNYRESILGFLCLGTETAPGNAGLKDIIAGLRWVKENIGEFGGNPNDVTLFGHGSGAAVVDLVTISPMGEGLVNKVITQSGNALAPWAVSRDNLHYALRVAEALGHIVTGVESLSAVFTRASVPALMAAINELDLTDNSLAFSPCLERDDLPNVETFMTKSPFEVIKNGEHLQVPFITGFVDNEGTIRSDEIIESDWLLKMRESFPDFLQSDLKFESDKEREDVANTIRSFYFEDGDINTDDIDEFISYHGDTMILVSSIREARLRAASSSAPIYLYQFSYKGALGEPFEGPIPVPYAAHGEELAYLFPEVQYTQVPEMDLTVADILVERWTNFAKNGLPTSDTSQVLWLPFTAENPHYLRVLNHDEIKDASGTLEVDLINPHPDKVNFWDIIYDEHFLDANTKWEVIIDASGENTEEIQDSSKLNDLNLEADSKETSFWNDLYKKQLHQIKRLLTRNDDDNVEGSGDENDEEGGEGGEGEEAGQDEEGEEDEDEDEEGGDNGAASTVAYTFSILCLFSILEKILSTLTLS